MTINKGTLPVNRITVGSSDVKEIYQGSNIIWQGDTQYNDPFWNDVLLMIPAENPASSTTPDLTLYRPSTTGAVIAGTTAGGGGNAVVNSLRDGYDGIWVGKNVSQSSTNDGATFYIADSGSEIVIPESTTLVKSPFTIEFWLYYAGATLEEGSNSTVSFVVSATPSNTSSSNGDYQFGGKVDRSIARMYGNTSLINLVNDTEDTVTGKWQHHALVRDTNDVCKYYVDGKSPSAGYTSTSAFGRAGLAPYFGAFQDTRYRNYSCNVVLRQIRYTKAARYTADFTPFQRFYYPGIV
tara:strand:- start:1215 stop:2099 length:885 start_codon:yes stop_codon:yes gene_type:complete